MRGGGGIEGQRGPVHRDLAVADAHKAAEIQHAGDWIAVGVDQHIDQPGNVLAVGADDAVAEDGHRFLWGDGLQRDGRGRALGVAGAGGASGAAAVSSSSGTINWNANIVVILIGRVRSRPKRRQYDADGDQRDADCVIQVELFAEEQYRENRAEHRHEVHRLAGAAGTDQLNAAVEEQVGDKGREHGDVAERGECLPVERDA